MSVIAVSMRKRTFGRALRANFFSSSQKGRQTERERKERNIYNRYCFYLLSNLSFFRKITFQLKNTIIQIKLNTIKINKKVV